MRCSRPSARAGGAWARGWRSSSASSRRSAALRTRSRSPTGPPRSTWPCSQWAAGRATRSSSPSLNFVAAANAIVHTGAEPVFCDVVGADELNLDPPDVAAAVTPRTKAWSPCTTPAFHAPWTTVAEIADRHGLAVVEDAAHAPGASLDGRMCGTLGQVGCFSFFSNKNLPVGEGGMIVTGDEELAKQLRLLRSHGMTTLTWDRHRATPPSYDVVLAGFNYRLDEVRAAVGLVQLSRLIEENEARARVAGLLPRGLGRR